LEEKAIPMEESQIAEEGEKNWEIAEKLFEEYLNNKEIPFFRVDQEKKTKSKILKEKGICRPDYIIQTKNDFFCIDVKFRSKTDHDTSNEKRFILDQQKIISLYYFQEEFHQETWLAYNDNLQKTEFYYISISKVYEYYINILKAIIDDNYFDYFHEVYHSLFTNEIKDKLWMYIPETLCFDQLSFDKGFYKESDKIFYKKEVDFYKSIWEDTITNRILKETKKINNRLGGIL